MSEYEGLKLTLKYKYGCLFGLGEHKQIYIINRDNIYKGYTLNDGHRIDKRLREYSDIKTIFEERFNKIYNKTIINYKKRKTGGHLFNDKTIEDIFILPKLRNNNFYKDFYENLIKNDRSYIHSTRKIESVKSILLCFFHIDDFDVSINSSFIYNSTRPYRILSEQKKIDKLILDITTLDIEVDERLHPVYIDVEIKNKEKRYYLSDGNHRINVLKENGYNGFVPAYVCDYTNDKYLSVYDLISKKRKIEGGKK